MTQGGTIIPCWVSCGVPYTDTEDPRCKPRLVTAVGKGSYVKVVDREGKRGQNMVIVGAIGTQKDTAQAHNLDISSLAAVRAPDVSFDTDE